MLKTWKKTLALLCALSCVLGASALVSCTGGGSSQSTGTEASSVRSEFSSDSGESDSQTSEKEEEGEAEKEYAVSVKGGKGGTIAADVAQAKRGETVTATIRANAGYRLKKVYANGVEILFDETEDFTYTAKALMQEKPLELEAVFAENPVLTDEYAYTLTAAYSQAKEKTAISYWKARYGEEGLLLSVLVKDDNVVQNVRLDAEKRDFVELRISAATTARTLAGGNALRCLVTADGTFLLQKCLGGNDYAPSGYGLGLKYGDNFETERVLCTNSKNRFDGYAVEVFLGYDLLGLTKEEAVGKLTFAPSLNNALGTDGKVSTYGNVYASAETVWAENGAEGFFADEYKCSLSDSATWLVIGEDGTFASRYAAVSENADWLFLGDGTFADERWMTFARNVAGSQVCNAAFENVSTGTLLTQSALDFAQTVAPKKLLLSVGREDLSTGASAPTTAKRIVAAIEAYHAALPQAELFWTALLPTAESVTGDTAYRKVNEFLLEYAKTTEYLTVIDCNATLGGSAYYYEKGELSAEGYDRYAAAVCAATGLRTATLTLFGESEYGSTTAGWTETDGTLALESRDSEEKQYAYFAGVSSSDFHASASFAATDVFNGDETPQFGMVLANASERLYFYVEETYLDGELMGNLLGYKLYVDGKEVSSATVKVSMYYTDGQKLTLTVNRTADGVELYVGAYKAFTVTEGTLGGGETKASVGVYSENRGIQVTEATVKTEEENV